MTRLVYWIWMVAGCSLFGSKDEVEYTVVSGDTLTKIARHHDVSVEQLLAWNGLSGDRIEVGQRLLIRRQDRGLSTEPSSAATDVGKPRGRTRARSRLPAAKPCLKGPSLDDLDGDDVDMRASVGLSTTQIRKAMGAALPALGGCIEGAWPDAVVDLSISVGCNGRVTNVVVVDDGGLQPALLSCFSASLRAASFPAHDIADGTTFRYPLTLSSH